MTSNVDISNLSIDDTQNDDQVNVAASRLAQEAQQALHLGSRGVTDITREFTAASNQLPPGELVKDAYFTLFDAVSALEVSEFLERSCKVNERELTSHFFLDHRSEDG